VMDGIGRPGIPSLAETILGPKMVAFAPGLW
jgi:hypothetical protein